MTDIAERQAKLARRLATRGDLTAFLTATAEDIGADSYMLVAIVHDEDRTDARIIASNWNYDAIQLSGLRLIASLAECPLSAAPGVRPNAIVTRSAPGMPGIMDGEEAMLLAVLGHAEIYPLRLHVGPRRYVLLLSAESCGSIHEDRLQDAQMRCCYALSGVPGLLAAAAAEDPLSDRERECLFWVSEGKTSDDVATIIGVTSNTVNGYITNAMQKLAASNRTMAIATAIRSGII